MSAWPDEETLRTALDSRGLLIPGALAAPPRTSAYTVFSQRSDVRLEMATLERHAAQFFRARIGLTVEKKYDAALVSEDCARVVIAPENGTPSTRFVFGRARDQVDLDVAERADVLAGSPGLGLLARRCPSLWLVAIEEEDDRHALLLAAVLSSVLLGPILAPNERELFGVRTARLKLEER
jgi:hypothetical protein